MAKRRGRGEGSVYYVASRNRWIAEITIGKTPAGKRITRTKSATTKTEARAALIDLYAAQDKLDAAPVTEPDYTVREAVDDWFRKYKATGKAEATYAKVESLIGSRILPFIGEIALTSLEVDDVDRWLEEQAETLVSTTLNLLHSIMRRAINRAIARKKVTHNVMTLCEAPAGKSRGRPSKALSYAQVKAVLATARAFKPWLFAYLVLSLLTGARTEELRALTWENVDLTGSPDSDPPIRPNIKVWTSVRESGDTKTKKSRRTLGLAELAIYALTILRTDEDVRREKAGERWAALDLVFTTRFGTALNVNNVRRDVRTVLAAAGLDPDEWTPRELRHSFVSVASASGMPIEDISREVGHSGTAVTERVYRKQLHPVMQAGAETMGKLFPHEAP